MSAQENRRRTYAILLGLVSSVVFITLALWRVDLHGVWQALRTSQWWPWYVVAPIIYLSGHLVRGVRCQAILRPHCRLSTWTATNIVVIGYGANNFLPARMGEVVRSYVLSRKVHLSMSLSLALTFVERLMDGLSITLLLLVAAAFIPLPPWTRHLLWAASILFLSVLAALVLTMKARTFVIAASKRFTAPLPSRLRTQIVSALDRAISATDCLRDTSLAAQIAALSLVVWLIEGGMFVTVLPAFGLPANPLWAWMTLAVTNLGILIPSSPGYVGPFHYFCMRALMLFGVARETALGYAIVTHLMYYIPISIWGALALAAYGVRLGTAVRESAEATGPDTARDVAARDTGSASS